MKNAFSKYDRYFFVDESGNLGTDGRYFVIALVETDNARKLHNNVKRRVSDIKNKYPNIEMGSNEIKAHCIYPVAREYLMRKVFVPAVRVSYIVLDKTHLRQSFLNDKNRAYNYMLKLLLDRVGIKKNESFFIGLDNRTIKVNSLNSFEDYINIHFNYELCRNNRIGIKYVDSDSSEGYVIQAADYAANSIWAKFEYNYDLFYNIIDKNISTRVHFPYKVFGKVE